jgi:hypothetical protein
MAKITEIISMVTKAGGLARPNRFAVQIVPPMFYNSYIAGLLPQNPIIGQIAAVVGVVGQIWGYKPDYFTKLGLFGRDMQTRLNFFCQDAELPGKGFQTSDIRTYGSYFKIPSVDTYSDITLSFICGSDMADRTFFDAWSYTIQDPETADFNYLNDYATTISIFQLSETNNATYGCRLYQCWPVSIGEMKLHYAENNTYHILPVTFTYRKWINILLDTQTPTSVDGTSDPFGFDRTVRLNAGITI